MGGPREPQKGRGTASPAPPGDRQRKWWTPRNLTEALREAEVKTNIESGSWKARGLSCLNLKRLGRPWQTCLPSPLPSKSTLN